MTVTALIAAVGIFCPLTTWEEQRTHSLSGHFRRCSPMGFSGVGGPDGRFNGPMETGEGKVIFWNSN
jgi:hypothetical protein